MIALAFVEGTLEVRGFQAGEDVPAECRWDPRSACHRAPARAYADVVLELRRRKLAYDDQARRYVELEPKL